MIRTKTRVVVSISYFDFDFGDDLIAANAFANVARATIENDSRIVELNATYLSDENIEEDKEEEQEEEDKEEEQHDQTTD